jgi:hypothetical protein
VRREVVAGGSGVTRRRTAFGLEELPMKRRNRIGSWIAGPILLANGALSGQTDLLRVRGTSNSDTYGWAIGPAGDVDGDGVGDRLVGSPTDDTNGTDAGRVRVLSGRDFSVLRERFGDAAADQLGWGIGKEVGDIDADGFADVAVSAIYSGTGATDYSGAVYIYSGRDGSTLWKNAGTVYQENYGYSLARVGDVDGDGGIDFAVGAIGRQVNGVWRGGVEVWSGRSGALLFSENGGVGDWFGGSLAGVGDLDQDGVPDLLVGSFNDFPAMPGEAHVYSLKHGTELYCYSGAEDGDLFGFAIARLDDLDGDGVNEFAISAPTGHTAQPYEGRCYVYSGRRGRLLHVLGSDVADDAFGLDLQVHQDLDGDGLRELLVGAPGEIYSMPQEPGAIHPFSWIDCHATAQNYGAGWPGTNGVPSLTASNPPRLGEPITLDLGNSYGQPTIALLIFGFAKAQQPSSWDGDFLVAAPWVTFALALPAAGLAIAEEVDPDPSLCGLEVDVQLVHVDPGASDSIAFSAGLELILGGI